MRKYLKIIQIPFTNIITSSNIFVDVRFCTEFKFINDYDVYIRVKKIETEYYPIFVNFYSLDRLSSCVWYINNNKINSILYYGMIICINKLINNFITIKFKNESVINFI